jgi:hypothetical protein
MSSSSPSAASALRFAWTTAVFPAAAISRFSSAPPPSIPRVSPLSQSTSVAPMKPLMLWSLPRLAWMVVEASWGQSYTGSGATSPRGFGACDDELGGGSSRVASSKIRYASSISSLTFISMVRTSQRLVCQANEPLGQLRMAANASNPTSAAVLAWVIWPRSNQISPR